MRRHLSAILIILIVLAILLSLAVFFWVMPFTQDDSVETAEEVPVTPELIQSFKQDGYPITVERAFSVSRYGGWHGDGEEATVYKFDPKDAPELCRALKERHRDYRWGHSSSESTTIHYLEHLLPDELVPDAQSTLLSGRPTEGIPIGEIFVDPDRGLLFTVTNRF